MHGSEPEARTRFRQRVVSALMVAENAIYAALAVLLVVTMVWSIVGGIRQIADGANPSVVVVALDHLMVVLMLAEILHTVLLFVKTGHFSYQPFLMVGIIAGIRRILVLTAEESAGSSLHAASAYLWDLGLTTAMIVALTVALRIGGHDTPDT